MIIADLPFCTKI